MKDIETIKSEKKRITYEDCVKFMQEHPNINRRNLKVHYTRYRDAMKRLGVLDELCPTLQMLRDRVPIEECIEVARKYKTIADFRNHHRSMYNKIARAGLLEEAFQHIEQKSKKYRLIYVCEFEEEKSVYVGLTCHFNKRKTEHLTEAASAVYQHVLETGMIPVIRKVTEYISAKEASKKEGEFVELYKANGWKILNKVKTGGLGAPYKLDLNDKILELNKQHKTLQEIADTLNVNRSTILSKVKDLDEYMPLHHLKSGVPLEMYDEEGNVIAHYKSMQAAAKALGVSVRQIHNRINSGKFKVLNYEQYS